MELFRIVGIGVIAFINQRMLGTFPDPWGILPEFLGLIALLLVITLASQLALTTLGHHFVYRLRGQLIKRIMDTDIQRVEQIGSARLLASLSTDVRYITVAFVRLPELVQGGGIDGGCHPLFGLAIACHAGRDCVVGDGDYPGGHALGGAGLPAYGQAARC